jgi:PAS domain-containing protein
MERQPVQTPSTAGVLERADVLAESELDTLPVGMIQLDPSGKVLKFNQTESDLVRVKKAEVLGKSFFDEVAPCTRCRSSTDASWRGCGTVTCTRSSTTSSASATAGARTSSSPCSTARPPTIVRKDFWESGPECLH